MKRTIFIATLLIVTVMLGFSLAYSAKAPQTGEEKLAAEVINKLQEVTRNQQEIIQKLDELKQELYVIKIRVTHR